MLWNVYDDQVSTKNEYNPARLITWRRTASRDPSVPWLQRHSCSPSRQRSNGRFLPVRSLAVAKRTSVRSLLRNSSTDDQHCFGIDEFEVRNLVNFWTLITKSHPERPDNNRGRIIRMCLACGVKQCPVPLPKSEVVSDPLAKSEMQHHQFSLGHLSDPRLFVLWYQALKQAYRSIDGFRQIVSLAIHRAVPS